MRYKKSLNEGYFSGADTDDRDDGFIPHSEMFDFKRPDAGGRFTRLIIFRKSLKSLTYEYVEKCLKLMDNYISHIREVSDFQTYAVYSGDTKGYALPDNVCNDTENSYISGFSFCVALKGSFASMKRILNFIINIDKITYTPKTTADTKLYFCNLFSDKEMRIGKSSSFIPSIIISNSLAGAVSGSEPINSRYTLEAIMLICQFLWGGKIEKLIAESEKVYGYRFRNYIEGAVKVYLKRSADYQRTTL